MFGRHAQFRRGLIRRLVSLALLLGVCASFFPLPLPGVPAPKKDTSQPFPCQDRSCGCSTADQCWKSCCCFSNAEKLVWAKKKQVKVPEYVFQAAIQELKTLADSVSGSTESDAKMCSLADAVQKHSDSCCSTSPQQEKPARSRQPEESSGGRTVIAAEFLKCKGQGHYWNSLPWTILPDASEPALNVAPIAWEVPSSISLHARTPEPPVPPPRLFADQIS